MGLGLSEMGSWRVLGASAPGTQHLARGGACEDAHHAAALDDSTCIVAVADGAGSARLGGVGAETAARWSVEMTAFLLCEPASGRASHPAGLESVLRSAVRSTRDALRREAKARDARLTDLATTLVLAVVTPSGAAVAQVGDGAAVVAHGDELGVASTVERGEYLNETTFLTSRRWEADLAVTALERDGLDALALLTDGLQLVALDLATGIPHPPFFTPLFDFAREPDADPDALVEFLGSERVCARTDDDKTLVLVVAA